MHLEDLFGDIIKKGRKAAGVSAVAAAHAAGLTESELAALEESGRIVKTPNIPALAALLGLHAGKLEAIANGWLPPKLDLSQWRELRQIETEQNGNRVNLYLVWDEATRDAALFDTGWTAEPALALLKENQLVLRHVFLTHSHEDHIAGLAEVRQEFPVARIHSGSKHAPPQQRIRANDFIHLGALRITNRDTPGHAEDGITYIIGNWPEDAPHAAVVGDAIYAGSIGGGLQSWDLAKQKIREQIFTLPPDTLICPGHGPFTTVATEKGSNPFFI